VLRLVGRELTHQFRKLAVLERGNDAEIGVDSLIFKACSKIEHVGLRLELIDLEILRVLGSDFSCTGVAPRVLMTLIKRSR
jgi:hypothetical protein